MSIASQTDVRKRVNIIKHFIAIADVSVFYSSPARMRRS